MRESHTAKFPLGQLVATRNAANTISSQDITVAVLRHLSGDWGELSAEDRLANEQAIEDGERLLSAYSSSNGIKFWIITEWDRSYTTILLPEDY